MLHSCLDVGEQYNVFTEGEVLKAAARDRRMVASFLGIPCVGQTRTRWSPIRSTQFPEEIPGLQGRSLEIVSAGNSLMNFACDLCRTFLFAEGYVALEQPFPRRSWVQAAHVKLWRTIGVIVTV